MVGVINGFRWAIGGERALDHHTAFGLDWNSF